ncbi:glycine oxidase ThiO [Prochlorococcus sp. MIT 1307]|uniref:glycine oxidase ThiO n=1 Tax=Prochlorococcus sp. MIT 1307 TaxID=3096219 RepID=UPI002A760B63|nr:glycine oxidase ThiO [Prochlorococcus sp. MIT 1307]
MASRAKEPLLIIGGGLIGLAVAYELAKRGRCVEILSRRRSEAAGFVAAGMLAPHAEGLTGNLLKLGQLSLDRIPQWVINIEQDSGINCGLKHCGIVVPFCTPEARDAHPTATFGNNLNRQELEIEVPGIAPQWQTGLLFNQDGQIDNRRRLMRALEKACVGLGVHFQEGVEVLDVLQNEKEFKGVKVRNAEGKLQLLPAKEAVLCSGAWSKQIFKAIPIVPVKGQMLSLQGPKNALKRILFGPGTYLVPREDGLIVIGATSEKKAGFQEGLTPSGQLQLHQGITALLPAANQWPQMERWWGFRPCSPDEGPLLGSSVLKGLWLATGHHRNGVLLAGITAELLAKSICKIKLSRKENELITQFRWNRFEQK